MVYKDNQTHKMILVEFRRAFWDKMNQQQRSWWGSVWGQFIQHGYVSEAKLTKIEQMTLAFTGKKKSKS